MAAKCDMQEKINELSQLLQKEKDLRVREKQGAAKREKGLRAEMKSEKESLTNKNFIKTLAVERERDSLLKEVQSLKMDLSDITEEHEAERAAENISREQRDELQQEVEQLKLQLHEQKDLLVREQQRATEREKALLAEMESEKETLTIKNFITINALEKERDTLLKEVQSLKKDLGDITEENKAERAAKKVSREQMDELQQEVDQLKLQLLGAERQLRDSEREKEQNQREQDEQQASVVPELDTLEGENEALVAQTEELKMSCITADDEKGARPTPTFPTTSEEENITVEDLQPESSGEKKTKKRKGWKKCVHYAKPWNWVKK
ncbi:trichohyalin-like [Seriola aureovittata]|uniref:trichohyalin-like n=1 Tax=Seriola aureovittata TaxID=2871759 RepID=UPI0024BECD8F|nr:trichohyalin-like [Seriola aureovittata]